MVIITILKSLLKSFFNKIIIKSHKNKCTYSTTGQHNRNQQQNNQGTINGNLFQNIQTIHMPANTNDQEKNEICKKLHELLDRAMFAWTWNDDDKVDQVFVLFKEIKESPHLLTSPEFGQLLDDLENALRAAPLEKQKDRWNLFNEIKNRLQKIFQDDLNKIN